MPLHDHFHPPVSNKRHWSELHGWWPGEIARQLFDTLPPGYQAGPRVYLGSSFEVDVSVAEEDDRPADAPDGGATGTATLATVEPPFTAVADRLNFDEYEVRIYDDERERTLVAAIEIVSPSNKDRPDTRALFVSKCAALLREGVCVSIVDIVTDRLANLYAELVGRVGQPDPRVGAEPPAMYAASLRIRRQGKKPPLLDAWYFPLALGQPLPTIPIWLSPNLLIQLPLEPSYKEVCRLLRIA
jgi:hypothetical protein